MKVLKSLLIIWLFLFGACEQVVESNEADSQKNEESKEQLLSPSLINNKESLKKENLKNKKYPEIIFEREEYDFGKIVAGEKVSYSFKFNNTGEADLVIASTKASCGCTVSDFPKYPIKPGKGGVITATFDSKGKSGNIKKSITIYSNTNPNTNVVYIKGEVIGDK